MTIDLRAASSLPRSELAALFTRAYEGYFVPVQVDEAALGFLERTFDLDLDASFVAFDEGSPVGLVNLGVRSNRGWIGGLGIVPEARRQGFGRALMEAVHEQARSRGIEEISLEVIEGNDAAFRLYENLGYELLRWVEIGSLEAAPGDAPADEDCEAAHERIRAGRQASEPWQREDATLRHYSDLRGLTSETGAAVYRATPDGRVVLMQFAGDQDAAREVVASLRALGPVSVFNVPEDDPVASALRQLGGRIDLRQREMRLRLAPLTES